MTNKKILVYYTSFSDRALEPKTPTSHQDFVEAPHQKLPDSPREERVHFRMTETILTMSVGS